MTYKFDVFSSGFVTVLAAEQTEEGATGSKGQPMRRQGLRHMRRRSARDLMILSGDQLYSMDFRQMLRTHRDSNADANRGGDPRSRGPGQRVRHPQRWTPVAASCLRREASAGTTAGPLLRHPGHGLGTSASMGIYIFRREILEEAVSNPQLVDFGRHVILTQCRANACTPTSIAATGRCRDHPVLFPGQLGAVPADSAV